MLPTDNIGVLYSTTTGIVLRTINPPSAEQGHLDWLQNNIPQGTSLLLLNKQVIGADDNNMPNLDFIIPHVQQNHQITLSYGITCAVVDQTNKVVDVVLCCPVLYQNMIAASPLTASHVLVQQPANVGDSYNPVTKLIVPVKAVGNVTTS